MLITKICFFCGGHQDTRLEFPSGEYTAEANHQCPLCLSLIAPGHAAIFECTEKDPGCGNPLVKDGVWYTGRWTTVGHHYLPNIYGSEVAARVAQAGAGTLNSFNYRAHRLDTYTNGILQ